MVKNKVHPRRQNPGYAYEYVNGAIARSASRSSKCHSCRETLVTPDVLEQLELDESLDYSAATFLDSINSGGLARPADYTFMLCVHCWRVFEDIRATADFEGQVPCLVISANAVDENSRPRDNQSAART